MGRALRRCGIGALAVLAGCGGREEISWLEGFDYGWQLFNHRVSTLDVRVADGAATVAVVGGTSTTGVPLGDLPQACDPDTCAEFPFVDTADVGVRWGSAETRSAVGVGSITLEVGADGASGEVEVPLSRRANEATAVLNGFALTTAAAPIECYDPAFGWHPRRIRLSLGAATVDGDVAIVPVEAIFEAGASLEAERACIDAVAAQAVVGVRLDVLVVGGSSSQATVAGSASFGFSGSATDPGEQALPDPAAWDVGVAAERALVGWSTVDFQLHTTDPDGRGAYLRTLGFHADAVAGVAEGFATNYSPGTQLSGFDYTFEGVVEAVDLGADVNRGLLEVTYEIVLDDDGAAVPMVWEI